MTTGEMQYIYRQKAKNNEKLSLPPTSMAELQKYDAKLNMNKSITKTVQIQVLCKNKHVWRVTKKRQRTPQPNSCANGQMSSSSKRKLPKAKSSKAQTICDTEMEAI
jgi:hypothetical protein